MKNLNIYLSILLVWVLSSCTKVIDLKLDDDTGKLVIEGTITNVKGGQAVKLSTNVPFTDKNVYPAVSGAIVTIKDEKGTSYPFVEKSPGNYTMDDFVGIPGSSYTMDVVTAGKTYAAHSTMPGVVKLDSITTKASDFDAKKRQVVLHYQDPAGISNQYRVIMYVNDVQVKAIFTFNDDFNDGKYIQYEMQQQDVDIYANDKITIEMQCIDKPIYTYWLTLMRQGGGFFGSVTPSNPPTNISPASLGYFSAHTSQTATIIAK